MCKHRRSIVLFIIRDIVFNREKKAPSASDNAANDRNDRTHLKLEWWDSMEYAIGSGGMRKEETKRSSSDDSMFNVQCIFFFFWQSSVNNFIYFASRIHNVTLRSDTVERTTISLRAPCIPMYTDTADFVSSPRSNRTRSLDLSPYRRSYLDYPKFSLIHTPYKRL